MTNYIKLIVLSVILIVGLSACMAESKNNGENDVIYSVDSDSSSAANLQPGEWLTNYQQALKTAQKEDKQIFVNFTGSDWCIWCKRLSKEVLTQKPFIDYAQANYVLLKLDFPQTIKQSAEEKKQNEALAKQYNIQGFPTIVIMDKTGKELARTGYRDGGAESYIKHLKTLIK